MSAQPTIKLFMSMRGRWIQLEGRQAWCSSLLCVVGGIDETMQENPRIQGGKERTLDFTVREKNLLGGFILFTFFLEYFINFFC